MIGGAVVRVTIRGTAKARRTRYEVRSTPTAHCGYLSGCMLGDDTPSARKADKSVGGPAEAWLAECYAARRG